MLSINQLVKLNLVVVSMFESGFFDKKKCLNRLF
jgi:hypothetical protein